jgi:hypothetical protein
MPEKETPAVSVPDQEPSAKYAIGDVVRVKHSLNPDALWLLTTPITHTPEGFMTGGIEISPEDGEGLGAEGSISVADILETVGLRKTIKELETTYVQGFEKAFGTTLSHEAIVGILSRQIDSPHSEQ